MTYIWTPKLTRRSPYPDSSNELQHFLPRWGVLAPTEAAGLAVRSSSLEDGKETPS